MASGYNAKTSNDDADQLAASSVSSRGVVDTPILSPESSSISQGEDCTCIVCRLKKGTHDSDVEYHCNFADCNYVSSYYRTRNSPPSWEVSLRLRHVKSHYQQDPDLIRSLFLCPVENCRYKSKRWAELGRHTSAKHCNNPTKFECPEIGCKYNGEGNGFTRKDKLTAHKKTMHYGRKTPGQAMKALKPAPASTHAGVWGASSAAADKV